MNATETVVKNAVHDKLQAQVNLLDAKLKTIKARAEQSKATLQIKAVSDLSPKIEKIHQDLRQLKQTNESAFEHAKAAFEKHLAEFEQSVRNLENRPH